MGKVFADDKPKSCEYCYYHAGGDKCSLGKGDSNCYYRLKVVKEENSRCTKCPYKSSKDACVGICWADVFAKGHKKGVQVNG